MSDNNQVILAGRLATTPQTYDTEGVVRLLLTVKQSEPRRRVDLIPVMWRNADDDAKTWRVGQALRVEGQVQRRFWAHADGRGSRLEIVAQTVSCVPRFAEGHTLPDEVLK